MCKYKHNLQIWYNNLENHKPVLRFYSTARAHLLKHIVLQRDGQIWCARDKRVGAEEIAFRYSQT